jgi:hypothetical protein
MDTRRAPQRIVYAHPPDQCPQIGIDWWPAAQGAGFPSPVPAETSAVPTQEGLRPDDGDRIQDRRKPPIQLDQEPAIAVRELDATSHPPPQHGKLMSERGVFRLKSAFRLEWRGEQSQQEIEQRDRLRGR